MIDDHDEMPTDEEIRASVEAFRARRQYTSFDRATLESIPDDAIETTLNDYVCNLVGNDFSNEYAIVSSLSSGFRAIYTTLHVEGEVNNGGFNQYFWNSEGKLAELAAEGFLHIGAPEYADLMKRAIAAWQDERESSEPLREVDTLEAFSESYEHSKLNILDDEFYELAEVSHLSELRVAFARSHLGDFITND